MSDPAQPLGLARRGGQGTISIRQPSKVQLSEKFLGLVYKYANRVYNVHNNFCAVSPDTDKVLHSLPKNNLTFSKRLGSTRIYGAVR